MNNKYEYEEEVVCKYTDNAKGLFAGVIYKIIGAEFLDDTMIYAVRTKDGKTVYTTDIFEKLDKPLEKDIPQSNRLKVINHMLICDELNRLYEAKNKDYGDSFTKTRDTIPNAILVRLSDKYFRLVQLMSGNSERQVKDESIDDTLMDMANYCIMELVERAKIDKE